MRLPRRVRPALTLRTRLALWTAALLLASSTALLLIFLSGPIDTAVQMSLWPPCAQTSTIFRPCQMGPPAIRTVDVRSSPGNWFITLGRMGTPALMRFAVVLLSGTALTYWVAGFALRPLGEASRAARKVDIDTLDARLPVDRPSDEIRDLSVSFNSVLDRLEEGIARERRFISDASHELRTPLAIMRTNLDVAGANREASLGEYREAVGAVERSLARLERLVENLFVLATDRRLSMSEGVRLGRLLAGVLDDMRPAAEDRGVSVSLDATDSLELCGNEALLQQVFSNLVENAIVYNREGGWVRVTARQEQGNAVITIADSGAGIPADQLPHVFDRFWRAERSRSRSSGGAGLGLALVAEIVRRHGGRVTAASEVEAGSTFIVFLPLCPRDDAEGI